MTSSLVGSEMCIRDSGCVLCGGCACDGWFDEGVRGTGLLLSWEFSRALDAFQPDIARMASAACSS
eukprot:8358362-Prorocentrum_lima.AAC.1